MLEKWNHASLDWKPDPTCLSQPAWSRDAGLNEASFYHYGLSEGCPSDTFCRVRVRCFDTDRLKLILDPVRQLHAWSMLRARHPLLDCHIVSRHGVRANESIRFRSTPTGRDARAAASFSIKSMDSWEKERDILTNCVPRLISDECLSRLYLYSTQAANTLEIVMVCSHAITDAASILAAMNGYLSLLASNSPLEETSSIVSTLVSRLPSAAEAQMPCRKHTARERWREALAYVLWDIKQRKPKIAPHFTWTHKTPTTRQLIVEFDVRRTRSLVSCCRRERCTIGHLIYAASVAAFSEISRPAHGSWISIGTPANARRLFRHPFNANRDEVVLALAFLDVRLPCIELKGSQAQNVRRLWILARRAKTCVQGAIADPLFPYYCYIAQETRLQSYQSPETPSSHRSSQHSFGSSAIGSIDGILSSPQDSMIELQDLSIGMRARAGECLMHSYSFQGKLRLSVMYDEQLGTPLIHEWLGRTQDIISLIQDEAGPAL